jgi:hypothetical protein
MYWHAVATGMPGNIARWHVALNLAVDGDQSHYKAAIR